MKIFPVINFSFLDNVPIDFRTALRTIVGTSLKIIVQNIYSAMVTTAIGVGIRATFDAEVLILNNFLENKKKLCHFHLVHHCDIVGILTGFQATA